MGSLIICITQPAVLGEAACYGVPRAVLMALWPDEQQGDWEVEKPDRKTGNQREGQHGDGGWNRQPANSQGGESNHDWNGENAKDLRPVDLNQSLTAAIDRSNQKQQRHYQRDHKAYESAMGKP